MTTEQPPTTRMDRRRMRHGALPVGRRVLLTLAQLAGLAGTAYIVWNGSVVLRLRHDSFGTIAGDALLYALLAWASSATLTLILWSLFFGWNAESALRIAMRTSRTAVWFAPACILLAHVSRAFLIPALALVIGTTQMLYSQWMTMAPKRVEGIRRPELFEPLPAPPLLRVLAPSLLAALLFQSCVAARMARYPLLSAAALMGATSLLCLLLLAGGVLRTERPQSFPQAIFGILLTLIFAAGLTTVHLASRYPYGRNSNEESARNPAESLRELMRRLFVREPGGDDDVARADRYRFRRSGSSDPTKDVFPGIILVPEVKPYITLVAPTPAWLRSPLTPEARQPYGIPFSGEYWMYRPPFRRPPAEAHYQRGNPAEVSFKTNDNSRMNMEARQKFDRSIDIRCCRALDVAITNADRYTGTIDLEVFLIERRRDGEDAVNLGRNRVTVWPQDSWNTPDPRPVSEVLEFDMPGTSPIERFNEIRIVLHRDLVRAEKSAKLSIDRFILVPRNL